MAHGAVGTVVVLGGSLSGMLAAAAAARAASRVIVIERDALGGVARPRKGVPQARHNHNLFARGREVAEQLLPGVTDELRARGAAIEDSGARGRLILAGHRLLRVESGSAGVIASRALLDAVILARLRALPNVEIVDRTDVLGLATGAGGARVTGVRVVARGEESGERTIAADVVIDATGRGSRTPAWLAALGRSAPPEEQVEVRVAYVTRTFRRSPADLDGDRHVLCSGVAPDRPRGGVAFAVEREPGERGRAGDEGDLGVLAESDAPESDRWMVLLFAYGGARPPTELEAFRAEAAALAPELGTVSGNEPLGDAVTFAYPRAARRRYDRLSDVPEGLLVFGDALVSTNPSWGAGMTSAALQAEALERELGRASDVRALSRRWHAAAIAASEDVWAMTTENDRAFACVPGAPALPSAAIQRYVGAIGAAGSEDPVVARAMIRVVDRVAHPATIFAPSVVLRVAWAALARRARRVRGGSEPASRILGA